MDGNAPKMVALAVVQSYNPRRKVPRSEISLVHLESCLSKAAFSAAQNSGNTCPHLSSSMFIILPYIALFCSFLCFLLTCVTVDCACIRVTIYRLVIQTIMQQENIDASCV